MGDVANLTLVPVSAADVETHRDLMETVVLRRWGERCGKACAEHWNETVGKILNLSATDN